MHSVVICASNKFGKEALAFAEKLRRHGVVVFTPHFYTTAGGDWKAVGEFDKKFVALGLTHDHFYKIRMADIMFVYNKGGYSGISVSMEIGYAVALNKPVYALSGEDAEICRGNLFSDICATSKALLTKLK